MALLPRNRTSPLSGSKEPPTIWNRVVFPAPFGPISAVIFPASKSTETPSTACTPSNAFEISRHSIVTSPTAFLPLAGNLSFGHEFIRRIAGRAFIQNRTLPSAPAAGNALEGLTADRRSLDGHLRQQSPEPVGTSTPRAGSRAEQRRRPVLQSCPLRR